MWIEKIRRGVLQVSTESGTHFVQPSLLEKLRLLWTFRNFRVLPEQVLNDNERQFIGHLCSERRLRKVSSTDFAEMSCVIGTVDLAPSAPKKPARTSVRSARPVSA
jgi:hypothetical protein